MLNNSDSKKAIFITVDVQKTYLRILSDEEASRYACALSVFSGEMGLRGVKTVPVVFSASFPEGLYTRPFPKKGDKDFFEALLFSPDFLPASSEAVCVKSRADAFWDGSLKSYVDKKDIKTIFIAGMYTTQCVMDTIGGALNTCGEDVSVVVVQELLVDNGFGWLECQPSRHRTEIETMLSDNYFFGGPQKASRVSFATAAEALARYPKLPKSGQEQGRNTAPICQAG